jgi:hypothetical protein
MNSRHSFTNFPATLLFLSAFVCSCLFPASSRADDCASYRNAAELTNCSFYRSKKNGVPVYDGPDTTSSRLDTLALGEEVCYIGEENDFAILQWDKQQIIRGTAPAAPAATGAQKTPAEKRAYVRLVDLWEPRGSGGDKGDLIQRIKNYYYYGQYGGVPDDPLWLFRPMINTITGNPDNPTSDCPPAH